jgi:SAM-dependent methyltransferase
MDGPATSGAPRLALGRGEAAALRSAARTLSRLERWHLSVRFSTVPWDRILPAFSPDGSLVDFGCGPGLLSHLLSRAGFSGTYLGLDPDPRKVDRARRWLPESAGRRFASGSVLAEPSGPFAQAALIDVLYLVPPSERSAFVSGAARWLVPGGLLVAVTSGGGAAWKRLLDGLQERLAVGLGVTRGATVALCDGAEVSRILSGAGFVDVTVSDIGDGYLHGFELVRGRRPNAP